MQNDILSSPGRLSDSDLVAQLKGFVARDRQVSAQLIAHLAELDTRDMHLREGYASLFVYCRDALGFSEWESYNRIEVARASRRFPLILGLLAEGSIHLTTVRLLAPHLTPDNHREVLEEACGKKKPEVEQIVARLCPRPDVPSSIRRIPAAQAEVGLATAFVLASQAVVAPAAAGIRSTAGVAAGHQAPGQRTSAQPVCAPAAVTPLAPDRYKLQVTIGGETLEKLSLAKDMLSHAVPSGDDAIVLDRALTALLAELAKKKFAETSKPRRSRGTKPGARQPAAKVRRGVWLRDMGRCAFVAPSGHRCEERRFLEFHHVDPYALGGEASVDQIQLRCRRHNDYEGRLYFGEPRRGASPCGGGRDRSKSSPSRGDEPVPGTS